MRRAIENLLRVHYGRPHTKFLTVPGPLDRFVAEDRAVLRVGLESAAWISVDDTSARHARADGVTTQIGDARFTAFRTDTAKSRLNFLALLRAGYEDYVVDDTALAYMRTRALAGPFLERFRAWLNRSGGVHVALLG